MRRALGLLSGARVIVSTRLVIVVLLRLPTTTRIAINASRSAERIFEQRKSAHFLLKPCPKRNSGQRAARRLLMIGDFSVLHAKCARTTPMAIVGGSAGARKRARFALAATRRHKRAPFERTPCCRKFCVVDSLPLPRYHERGKRRRWWRAADSRL